MSTTPTDSPTAGLRVPLHQVSPRAVTYWRTLNVLTTLIVAVVLAFVWFVWSEGSTVVGVLSVGVLVVAMASVVVEPAFKFRVHRWEVDDLAVYTRSGWVNVTTRIAPLSRVQTVEFSQNALMRLFNLASLQVTTASAEGAITIEGLDADLAKDLVARLTAITGADHGDAT